MVTFEERQAMREGIARELGIALYKQYSEPQTAHLLSRDVSTVKRWRRKGLIPYVKIGADGVRYLGIQIADIYGGVPWEDTPSESIALEPTGLGSDPVR